MVTPNTIRKISRLRRIRFKRKVMEKEEGYTYLNTIGDLKDHIGEILLFSYGSDKSKHTWMKKVTNVKLPDYFPPTEIENAKKTVYHHFVYGTHNILLEHEGKPSCKLLGKLNEDRMSNAQEIVRTPTKEEMKTYMNVLRKYRVFGNN